MLKNLFFGLTILFVLGVGVGAVALGVGYYSLTTPVDATQTETTRFVIPKGQSTRAVAQRLAEAGFVRHPLAIVLQARFQQPAPNIQAGSFLLSKSMTPAQILLVLSDGSEDTWVTLLEGWRAEEIAESLGRQELPEFDVEEFTTQAKAVEGTLFPDTYLIPKAATAETLLSLLANTYEKKVTDGLAEEIQASEHSMEDALVMASIVQREERNDANMPIVAGILWNRVRIGMALQADATLQYAKGYDAELEEWWVPPTSLDKQRPSPYNTYLNPGLPPRPISNPGVSAIEAALAPAETDALFYLHDNDGKLHTAKTYEEHQQNISRYLR
jgi:UPF0755 protein